MSLFEKSLILGSLAGMGCISVYTILKSKGSQHTDKNEVFQKQQYLSQKQNVKILYSSMSFFYLHGFKQEEIQSFYDFYDMLNISKPNFIALQLSQEEYQQKYLKVINHPLFKQTIEKVEFYIKTKNDKELQNLKEIKLKNLEKIFAIEYCRKNKCQIIYGQQPDSEYKIIEESKIKLRNALQEQLTDNKQNNLLNDQQILTNQEIKQQVKKIRENDYVDQLMKNMKPSYSLIPQSPYKTIVGLADEELIEGISESWKNKFLTIYGHQIIDDKEQKIYQQHLDQQIQQQSSQK